MKFSVYSCRLTFELCTEAKQAGFQHVWTPHRLARKLRSPKNRFPYVEEVWEAAVPGYVYGPAKDQARFRNWCPAKFNLSPLTEFYGPPGLPKHLHTNFIRAATVDLEDLQDHDAAVRALHRLLDARPARPEYSPGDVVELEHAGAVVQGVIHNFKSNNRVRIRISLGFITTNLNQIKKVVNG